jgi:hypothetical protein
MKKGLQMNITIDVNNKRIELTEFPTKIIINVILGILQSLRGVDEIDSAVISLSTEE